MNRQPSAKSSALTAWLSRHVRSHADQPALWIHDGTEFVARSWRQIADDVARVADAFDTVGIRSGDRVVHMAENRYEWLLVDLALLGLGAVHVPLHANLPPNQAARQLRRADSAWLIVSRVTQGRAIRRELIMLRESSETGGSAAIVAERGTWPRLIVYERVDETRDGGDGEDGGDAAADQALLFERLIADADPGRGARALDLAAERIHASTPATILFTSGTLSEPKGVVLTHGNLSANALAIWAAFHDRPSERRICALPLSHIYARTCDLYAWLSSGGEMAIARRPDTFLADCQAFRPTFLNGVPYLFDRIRRKWLAEGASAGISLRDLLGGRIELCVCGGAALADDVFDFYQEHGVPLLPGYGLTEASPVVTASTLSHLRRGCVGRPIPDTEVRLAPDGEVLTRGANVMAAYWRDPESTEVALSDGWLRTGDIGAWDEGGFLRIVGRKKDLIVLSIGKNVAPAPLEALLASDPWIAQAAVFGEGRSHLVALVAPQPEVLPRIATGLCLGEVPSGELARHPAVHGVFAERIARLNQRLAPHEQIRRFALTDRPFLLERDEMTAKLTLRRAVIERNFSATVAALYDDSATETEN